MNYRSVCMALLTLGFCLPAAVVAEMRFRHHFGDRELSGSTIRTGAVDARADVFEIRIREPREDGKIDDLACRHVRFLQVGKGRALAIDPNLFTQVPVEIETRRGRNIA